MSPHCEYLTIVCSGIGISSPPASSIHSSSNTNTLYACIRYTHVQVLGQEEMEYLLLVAMRTSLQYLYQYIANHHTQHYPDALLDGITESVITSYAVSGIEVLAYAVYSVMVLVLIQPSTMYSIQLSTLPSTYCQCVLILHSISSWSSSSAQCIHVQPSTGRWVSYGWTDHSIRANH